MSKYKKETSIVEDSIIVTIKRCFYNLSEINVDIANRNTNL